MSSTAPASSAPAAASTDSKHVSFAPSTRSPTRKSARPRSKPGAQPNKQRPPARRPPRHMVFGIPIDDEALKSWSDEHMEPPPAELSGDALNVWYANRYPGMYLMISASCSLEFDLPLINGVPFTMGWDGRVKVPVVPLVDNYTTSETPSQELVAKVAKYMHQEGAQASWYQITRV